MEEEMKWAYGMNGAEEKCLRVHVGKPKGKRLLGIPRWKDNIYLHLIDTGLEMGMNWIRLAQNRDN
jgi:hypothetical protein